MLPQFKPVAALVILCGAVYGPETGFLVGAGMLFLWLLAEPVMEKLHRVKQKFGLELNQKCT